MGILDWKQRTSLLGMGMKVFSWAFDTIFNDIHFQNFRYRAMFYFPNFLFTFFSIFDWKRQTSMLCIGMKVFSWVTETIFHDVYSKNFRYRAKFDFPNFLFTFLGILDWKRQTSPLWLGMKVFCWVFDTISCDIHY